MAWTTPRTWVVGEIATASIMNTHIRDNLAALLTLSGDAALFPLAFAGVSIGANAWVGDGGTDHDVGGRFTIPWDAFAAVSSTGQWRMSFVYTVSVIAPGSPSAISLNGKLKTNSIRGTAAAAPIGTGTVGSMAAITNSLTTQARDTGYVSLGSTASLGTRHYTPVWNSNRTGGSGAGTISRVDVFLEVRPT